MPEVKPYRTPWESAQALVADHALTKYGIVDADPLKVVTDLVFMESTAVTQEDGSVTYIGPSPELRLAAAKVLLTYTRPAVKAIHMHVEGQVDVEHSHRAVEATSKAKSLLSLLGARKYKQGEVTEGETEPALTAIPADVVQH
jgi:hypothetical protein